MPGQLINKTLSSLAGGITQQFQEGRFDSQVEDMVNCIPSIARGVFRRNPIQKVAQLTGLIDISNSFTYSYDRGTGDEQYLVVLPGNGSMQVFNLNDGSLEYSTTGHSYLTIPVSEIAKDSFNLMTVGDTTFIVNKTVTTEMNHLEASPGLANLENHAFYWIKKTTSVVVEQQQKDVSGTVYSGSKLEGYEYTLNGYTAKAKKATEPFSPTYSVFSPNEICKDIESGLGISGLTIGDSAFIQASNPISIGDWEWRDSFGNEASLGVWKAVDSSDKLPSIMPKELDNFVVLVSGGSDSTLDDYYLQYNFEVGSWKEVVRPEIEYKIDSDTMPHCLYRLADDSFVFDTFKEVRFDGLGLTPTSQWKDREVGDEETNSNPSFITNKITDLFFHKNRLGFITGDSIILSRTGDYGNFFSQTVQDVIDDDPIDLTVATTDVTVLRTAVSTSGVLLLFSDDGQFTLTSGDGTLTPNSAVLNAITNYTYDYKAKAKAIGNKIYFTNKAGSFSQMYSYRLQDIGGDVTVADPLTTHIPSFIDKSVSSIVGHDVLGYTFLTLDDKKKELIVLNNTTKGIEDILNAFHRWEFDKEINSLHIINTNLYIVFDDGYVGVMDLALPGNIENVVYLDEYDIESKAYTSEIEFSEFFHRVEGKGTIRGRVQLRTLLYTITDNSAFMTSIVNKDLKAIVPEDAMLEEWDDNAEWDDNNIWVDNSPSYTRQYKNDNKITVLSNSANSQIVFSNNPDTPEKGFELATCNVEMYFHQRSQRT